jgi:hypothetical protein
MRTDLSTCLLAPHIQVGGIFNPNIRHTQPFTVKELLQHNVAPLCYNQVCVCVL